MVMSAISTSGAIYSPIETWMKILGKMKAYISLLLVDGTDRNGPCHYELVGTPCLK